jgi:hypothetical protein
MFSPLLIENRKEQPCGGDSEAIGEIPLLPMLEKWESEDFSRR